MVLQNYIMDTTTPKTAAPRGRPRSDRTQQAIRQAATELFAERGYSHVSMRDIAAAAGVDAGLIVRHFGSKDALFLETMGVDPQLRDVVEGPLQGLGRRILTRLLEIEPGQLTAYATLYKALDRTEVRDYLLESTRVHLVDPLSERLGGPNARLRAELIAAQVGGLFMAVGIMESPDAGIVELGTILETYAAGLQALIDDA